MIKKTNKLLIHWNVFWFPAMCLFTPFEPQEWNIQKCDIHTYLQISYASMFCSDTLYTAWNRFVNMSRHTYKRKESIPHSNNRRVNMPSAKEKTSQLKDFSSTTSRKAGNIYYSPFRCNSYIQRLRKAENIYHSHFRLWQLYPEIKNSRKYKRRTLAT